MLIAFEQLKINIFNKLIVDETQTKIKICQVKKDLKKLSKWVTESQKDNYISEKCKTEWESSINSLVTVWKNTGSRKDVILW